MSFLVIFEGDSSVPSEGFIGLIKGFQDFRIPKFQDSKISKFQDSIISKIQDSKISKFQ
jgi:hypothetical protein